MLRRLHKDCQESSFQNDPMLCLFMRSERPPPRIRSPSQVVPTSFSKLLASPQRMQLPFNQNFQKFQAHTEIVSGSIRSNRKSVGQTILLGSLRSSPLIRQSVFRHLGYLVLVESEIWENLTRGIWILGFGMRNTAQGIRNPSNDSNTDSKSHCQILESSTWNPESAARNLEFKTVLDSLHCATFDLTIPVCSSKFSDNSAVLNRFDRCN